MTDNTDNKNTSTSEKIVQSDAVSAADKDTTKTDSTEQAALIKEKLKASAPSRKIPPRTDTKTKRSQLKSPVSKLAILALLLALIALVTMGGAYYWFIEQQQMTQAALLSKTQKQLQKQLTLKQAETKQFLANQQQLFEQRLANISEAITVDNQKTIDKLQSTINRLSATQPTDWLIHEAEYLIRVAGRTIWLERDTKAAIGLLTDADQRLKELKDPKFLRVREVIHQDIEQLKLLPVLNTEDVLLSIMALGQQVDQLVLSLGYLPENNDASENLALSDDANDWQENLSKSWQRFLADFITIRRHNASVEPLLSPAQQQNLMINLKLKLNQAEWAVAKEKAHLYQKVLADIQTWLTRYFDMEKDVNQRFYQTIASLKNERVAIDYPSELKALAVIRQIINNKAIFLDEVDTKEQPAPTEKPKHDVIELAPEAVPQDVEPIDIPDPEDTPATVIDEA